MDLDWIIGELHEERKRLDRLIQAIEDDPGARRQGRRAPAAPAKKNRRGRKSMDGAARKEVSERMKQYWARKREEKVAQATAGP
jgi:hypothetical protein